MRRFCPAATGALEVGLIVALLLSLLGTTMNYSDSHPAYFLCLCGADRQPLFTEACSALLHRIEYADTIEEALVRGFYHPPQGVILDLPTVVRIGLERMALFLNLGVNWPVMRCMLSAEGGARIMCFEPPHGVTLDRALDGIASRETEWQHPRFQRRHLRLNMTGRAQVRVFDDSRWRTGEVRDISCGGCYLVMPSDAPPRGARLVVEFVDFQPGPERVAGVVAWSQCQANGALPPGVGIEFDPRTVTEDFRDYLARSPQLLVLAGEG